jgi:hypothetical protein
MADYNAFPDDMKKAPKPVEADPIMNPTPDQVSRYKEVLRAIGPEDLGLPPGMSLGDWMHGESDAAVEAVSAFRRKDPSQMSEPELAMAWLQNQWQDTPLDMPEDEAIAFEERSAAAQDSLESSLGLPSRSAYQDTATADNPWAKYNEDSKYMTPPAFLGGGKTQTSPEGQVLSRGGMDSFPEEQTQLDSGYVEPYYRRSMEPSTPEQKQSRDAILKALRARQGDTLKKWDDQGLGFMLP